MQLPSFLCGPSLCAESLHDDFPWNFEPKPESLQTWRDLPKPERRKRILRANCDWNVYSAVEGVNPSARVSKENPAACIRGLVADYDTVMSLEMINGILQQMPPEFQPQFIERSLGMKWRAVWVLEKPLLVTGNEHATAVYRMFAKKFKLATLLPGYDANSEKPALIWTNGGEWYDDWTKRNDCCR